MKNIDWSKLGFGYFKTDYNVRCEFKDGKWGELYTSQDENVNIHMASTCLHYGQEVFEGLKAFRGKDGKVRLFRVEENAKRMINSGSYLKMAVPTVEMFTKACIEAVKLNAEYIPPYGSGASLYLRPMLIGVGPQVGVHPSKDYMFIVFVTPVGPYYKDGFNCIKVIIDYDHDRAAPKGTGHVKVGGNYAASLDSGEIAHDKGYASVIFLDPATKQYIDECSAANFFGIRDGKYITPDSHSVLPSITNKSLRQIAEDLGLKVEQRKVNVDELPTFSEAGCCGTAAVISPIGSVFNPKTNETIVYGDGKTAGEWSQKLYKTLQGIQYCEIEDTHHWNTISDEL